MGKGSRNKKKRSEGGESSARGASGLEGGESSATGAGASGSGAPPFDIPPLSQPFQMQLPEEMTGDGLLKIMEAILQTQKLAEEIRGRQNIGNRALDEFRKAVEEIRGRQNIGNLALDEFRKAMQVILETIGGTIDAGRAEDATKIKELTDDLGDFKSNVTEDFRGLRARIETIEADSKAEIKNLGEEVEKVKIRIEKIGEVRVLLEELAREAEEVPTNIQKHISTTARIQYQELARNQATAFTDEFCRSGVAVVQGAMSDFLESSLLPDLKKTLEDTIERQIVRGMATIASQHSKFEISLSEQFQGCVEALWTTTNNLKSLLDDFRRQDLPFQIPNREEASSSGAKDQEHNSIGKVSQSSSRTEQL